jgi:L-cysteine desulfidase
MIDPDAVIRSVVRPVVGCTEPIAVALAVSLAREAAAGRTPPWVRGRSAKAPRGRAGRSTPPAEDFRLELLRVRTSRSIFKNAMAVGIPPRGTESGIHIAAAMGIFLPADGLNLLKKADRRTVTAAGDVLRRNLLVLEVDERDEEIYIEAMVICTIGSERHVGEAVISGGHDRVTLLRRDGRALVQKKCGTGSGAPSAELYALSRCSLEDLVAMARQAGKSQRAFLLEGVAMNRAASETGVRRKLGLGVGAALEDLVRQGALTRDLITCVRIATAGAADARMSGYEVEVMSSSGSGNQGIMAVLPVAITAEHAGAGPGKLAEALALSHLVTAHMTASIGLLSALCGCVVKAGIGATAGMAYILSGKPDVIESSIANMAANIVGEICDGAKVGCALKLATASGAATMSAMLARHGVRVPMSNGIVGASPLETFNNISRVSQAMKEADRAIIEIIEEKQS